MKGKMNMKELAMFAGAFAYAGRAGSVFPDTVKQIEQTPEQAQEIRNAAQIKRDRRAAKRAENHKKALKNNPIND